MKIDINKVKITPKSVSNDFKLCVFGEPNQEIEEWIIANSFETEITDKYTNIIIPDDVNLSDIFIEPKQYEYMDGFSPNLNKKLHIGHFSNLVLGKAFKSLGICNKTVSIYGDTLDGSVSKEEALNMLHKYQDDFNFHTDISYMASEMKYDGDLLKDGTGDYTGTKVFEIGENKIVGIKSNGQTSYFYQDIALAETLNKPTLYLTGNEQTNHFNILKEVYPHIQHIGLGLVKLSNGKMASRLGNVIFIDDFIEQIQETFKNDIQVIYNVFAGFILKSNPDVDKSINLDLISNPKNSAGLYISYTMARLQSAGCEKTNTDKFISKHLEYAYLKAKINLKPNILFEAINELCKEINSLYLTHIIKDNAENKKMFELKLNDLVNACKKLGLFIVKSI